MIAAYNPDTDLIANAQAILKQVDELVVVDDCSGGSNAESIFADLAALGITVVHQPENSGIGAALNRGIEALASNATPDFVLTFDQDSMPVPNYVSSALNTYDDAVGAGIKVGFVTAESFSGHRVPTVKARHQFHEAFDPMQSGFFVPMETIDSLGQFEAGFFIDCVDSEYTARARASGFSVLAGQGCEVAHRLGRRLPARLMGHAVRLGGSELSFNYYPPLRMYYIMRNGTTLARRYLAKAPLWVLRRLIEDAKAQLLRFTFSPDRGQLAAAAWAGLRDSFGGRQGRISSELASRVTSR
ncbi:glycosyltransferase [Arthrobacter sp. 9AX]|uniref:glycosyltransferase n=1 Tax=Arthrobacter sp. 9AX TaxID=2653131 RepID=UPI00135B85DB